MNLEVKPILAEPEEHYWRRRANRRVRKARLAHDVRRVVVSLAALGIVGTALFQGGSHAIARLKARAGLSVQRIELEGATGGARSIRAQLSGFVGQNIVDLNLNDVIAAVRRDPWVVRAEVKRVLPGTLRVSVVERHPAAVAEIDGKLYVVDGSGYVVAAVRSGSEHLPYLRGLARDEQLEAKLRLGVRTLARLREVAGMWIGEVAEMDLAARDRIVVRTVDPGPAILLDPVQVERNLSTYLELRREISRRAGRLDYVDLRWADRITVLPAADSTS